MAKRVVPLLTRNNPEREPLVGHVKVTQEDWLNVARDILVFDGVSEVKVLAIAERLEVSRSSFYWYFKNRKQLFELLLRDWEMRNTVKIIEHCQMQAETITAAVLNFFRCFVAAGMFDHGLDFAIREWSRRDGEVRQLVDIADRERLNATRDMFLRFGYSEDEAGIRAKILYFQQLGYHALDVKETIEERFAQLEGYLYGFTGKRPKKGECDAFHNYILQTGYV